MSLGTQIQFSTFEQRPAAEAVLGDGLWEGADSVDRWAGWHSLDDAATSAAAEFVAGDVIYEGSQDGAAEGSHLVGLWFNAPADEVEEYEKWFASEHGPMLLREPTWLRVRQIRVASSNLPVTHLVLHDLAGVGALSSDALEAARATPARVSLAERDWFANCRTRLFERAS